MSELINNEAEKQKQIYYEKKIRAMKKLFRKEDCIIFVLNFNDDLNKTVDVIASANIPELEPMRADFMKFSMQTIAGLLNEALKNMSSWFNNKKQSTLFVPKNNAGRIQNIGN